MKPKHNIFKIFIPTALIVFCFFIILLSYSLCIPDGCTFINSVCGDSRCINENIGQHLGERTSFFNVNITTIFSVVIVFFVVLAFFGILKNAEISFEPSIKNRARDNLISKLFNYLNILFSSGILNPKSY